MFCSVPKNLVHASTVKMAARFVVIQCKILHSESTPGVPCTINNQEPGQEYQSTKELFGENNDGKETSLVTSTVTTLQ